jgi:hypothetical protein
MSLALLNAVLSSRISQSSTRFAFAILAYHACSRCGRVYCGFTRLANEMNINLRNTKALIKKLRDDKHIEPTGETTPQGVIVYRLRGVSIATPGDIDGDVDTDTGGVSKSCWFCRGEVSSATPNKQVAYRQENDEADKLAHEREETRGSCARGEVCGIRHQPGLCGIDPWVPSN